MHLLAQIVPPTPSTCSVATQRSIQLLAPSARWARVLGAPPHRSWSLQRLCSGKNRKPFRAPPTARASRPDTARRPSQRSPPCLQPATPQPTRHASTPCPCRLPCAPVPAVDPLLHPLPVAGAPKWSPRTPEKTRKLAQLVRALQGSSKETKNASMLTHDKLPKAHLLSSPADAGLAAVTALR